MHKKRCTDILINNTFSNKEGEISREDIADIIEKAYKEGYKNALYDYAWYKDGEMRVGSGFYSYQDALKNFLKDFGE